MVCITITCTVMGLGSQLYQAKISYTWNWGTRQVLGCPAEKRPNHPKQRRETVWGWTALLTATKISSLLLGRPNLHIQYGTRSGGCTGQARRYHHPPERWGPGCVVEAYRPCGSRARAGIYAGRERHSISSTHSSWCFGGIKSALQEKEQALNNLKYLQIAFGNVQVLELLFLSW